VSEARHFGDTAARLQANGYRPVPILPGKKNPAVGQWLSYEYRDDHAQRFAGCGVGVLTGSGYLAVDIDVREPDAAAKLEALADEHLGKAPRRIGQPPKSALLYRIDSAAPYMATGRYRFPDDKPGEKPHRVEVLGTGKQVVAFGEHPDTHRPYQWNGSGDPLSVSVADLPRVTEAALREFLAEADALLVQFGERISGRTLMAADYLEAERAESTLGRRAADPELFRAALAWLPNDYDRDGWVRLAHSVKAALGDDGWPEFERWCQKSPSYTGRDTRRVWDSLKPGHIGAGTLLHEAQARGWKQLERHVARDRARGLVHIEPGKLHEYAAVAERLIAPETYIRGGKLVRIGLSPELTATVGPAIKRDSRQAVVLPISAEYMRRRLTELAEFKIFRRREKEWTPIDCPADLAANIQHTGDWAHFSPLAAIASAPFIRPDLTICVAAGYDQATGVYLRPSQSFPRIPVEPTRADAERARAVLLEPFGEFPFADPASFATFASHVLTAAVRVALGTSPLFFYTAPMPATGKTLLARCPNLIGTGNDPALRPYTDEAEELRKVLYSALLAGDSGLLFDNVPNGVKVRSPHLCAFATASNYNDRKLGTSDSQAVPNRCLVTITGNNITPCGDLARRSLVCRLDLNAESARGREFKISNLIAHVTARRPELLVAALTIVRAYVVAGQPRVAPPLESFEAWSELARDPLVWLGMADPVETQARETDDEIDGLRAAFVALHEQFGTAEFMARDIATAMGSTAMGVRGALESAGCSDASDSARVGYWLRAGRDRIAAGHKLVSAAGHAGVKTWRLRNT
jgi:putative DNA primase/helicase